MFKRPAPPVPPKGDVVPVPVSVAFVCTHNACRSQIAEALARSLAPGALEPYSAGTDPAPEADRDAMRVLRERFGVDAGAQHPKGLSDIPRVDVVVTMGCGVACPQLPAAHREDWGLEDPTGRGDEAIARTVEEIRRRVIDLRDRALAGEFDR